MKTVLRRLKYQGIKKILRELIHPTIYIFQVGKVGSLSLRDTFLKNYKGRVFHAHHIYQLKKEEELEIIKWKKIFRLPIIVISPVRDPITRTISGFYQNYEGSTGKKFSNTTPVEEQKKIFLRFAKHHRVLEWFDAKLRNVFEIDVFAKAFDLDKKWMVCKNKSTKVLIYRTDKDRAEQLKIISEFIGVNIPKWTYANISSEKEYKDSYKEFIDTVKLPDGYLSIMLNSRFSKHFFSKDERDVIRKRWQE